VITVGVMTHALQEEAESIADIARRQGHLIVEVESVTAGSISTALAAGGDASAWFSGGIVAYSTDLKRRLLGVTAADVLTPECAREMALGGLAATGATLAVAVTGVGGPDPVDGHPAGEVHICVGSADDLHLVSHRFAGSPEEIVQQSTRAALKHLEDVARGGAPG
jgi:nicotinamide-nucleotide amidase